MKINKIMHNNRTTHADVENMFSLLSKEFDFNT